MSLRKMTPRLRKFALTTHVSVLVGWLGAVAAYLALAVTGTATRDSSVASGAYRSMEVIGWMIIVPCSLAALLTGLVQSLGTEWGLFRHYWIVAKLSLCGSHGDPAAAHSLGESYGSHRDGYRPRGWRLQRASHATRSSRRGRPLGAARHHCALRVQALGRIGSAAETRAGRVTAI